MRAYINRRLLLIIPTLLILTILVFLSVRFIPGDIIDVMVGDLAYMGAGDIDREAVERKLGLDVPVYVQYGRWIGVLPTPDPTIEESHFNGILQGTLGESLLGGLTVQQRILSRLPVTIELGVLAIAIGLLIALPVGIYSAIRQYTVADYVGRSIAVVGLATPNFWLGIMVMIYPVIWWGWSPPMQLIPFREDPLGNLGMFLIPSLILGTYLSAATMRMTRTMMLEVLRQDYIRTAWSKGLKERVVVMRHAVKNALIPVVTLIGLQMPILVGGSVIMENIFNLPGLGRLMLDALQVRDYPLVSGINLLFATAVIGINLMIDLIYPYLDPAVRYR
ncbi:MAG: ABC transporter permease [Spirochaetaceae bacterium]|nr:ABC transporter permease [Spirochaetaceae bacterium]MDE0229574.1 ABC transporter permease [Spirochaetaceae bacterium]